MFPQAFIVTVVNVKTKEVKGFWLAHPEQIDEYEAMLEEDETMYVNEFPTPAPEADNDKE